VPGIDTPAGAGTHHGSVLRPHQVPGCPLADLAALLGLAERPGGVVTGVTHASGAARPGDLYAALAGQRRHGAEFTAAAAAAGAAAVLTDPAGAAMIARDGRRLPVLVTGDPRARLGEVAARVYGDPTTRVPVVGITGTAGKTSTAYLVDAGLRAAGRTPALLGTVETRLDDLVIDSARTTPEATDLQALLAVAVERGVDSVVMEVSSHALAMGRVGGVRFAVGAFTNFGLDHLDFHADEAGYFAAKARLFDGRCRVEVLNHDDPALVPLRRPGTVTCSAAGDPAATWRAEDIGLGEARDPDSEGYGFRQRFTAVGPDGAVPAGVGQPGRHSVANALLAIAALVAVGVDPAVAAAGVAAGRNVPGRLERVGGRDGALGVVDYAHKPDAIVAVLATLRSVASTRGGRLICVIGAGGDRDAGKRAPMGAAAARGADLVLVTDDNPRTEDPAAIRAEVLAGARVAGGAEVQEVAGRRTAIDVAVGRAAPPDVVAVLGKGHERGQEIAGQTHPFDDRTVLAEALGAVGVR
jgi:UDP-N-acetylmuramoyl-L-alanyl-D-glutamate--2,6-diaminopimelate ligase